MRRLKVNNQYKASVFSSPTRLMSVLLAIPGPLFPSSLPLFLLLLSTNSGCAKPYQQVSKCCLKLSLNTNIYSVHKHSSSRFDFSMFNCFARLHPKKENGGKDIILYFNIFMFFNRSLQTWIHHSPVTSSVNIHLVWQVSPEPNTERSPVTVQLSGPCGVSPVLCQFVETVIVQRRIGIHTDIILLTWSQLLLLTTCSGDVFTLTLSVLVFLWLP